MDHWDLIETYFLHHDSAEIFGIIIEGEEGAHWAWYVIDDENGTLLDSGSDDDLKDAKANALSAMNKVKEMDL